MRELNRHEIALVSGADGESVGSEVNGFCDAVGDTAALMTTAAIINYGGLSPVSAAAAIGATTPIAYTSVSGACQSLSNDLYAWASSLIQEFEDSTMEQLTTTSWY